jgi:hypothetical protein
VICPVAVTLTWTRRSWLIPSTSTAASRAAAEATASRAAIVARDTSSTRSGSIPVMAYSPIVVESMRRVEREPSVVQ